MFNNLNTDCCEKPDSVGMMEEREEETSSTAEAAAQLCEVCGTCFETRRGLSSHARSHLRQMGVCVSESSGAPITLLYHLITERDGKLPFSPTHSHNPNDTPPPKTSCNNSMRPASGSTSKPCHSKLTAKADLGAKLKIKIGELVRRHSLGSSSSRERLSSSTSLSPIKPHPIPPNSPPPVQPLAPPVLPQPQSDSLTDLTEVTGASLCDVHMCELCGAWYETKKGLISHARAHLRQLGVGLDSKAPPIQMLHELLQKEEEKLGLAMEEGLQAPPTGPITPPPAKKRKCSLADERTHGSVLKEVSCEFCGEKFKNTQCLASHARSHLRQLGITEWGGSPVVTLREVMAGRGSTSLPKPTRAAPTSPPATKKSSSSSSSSSLSPAKPLALLPTARSAEAQSPPSNAPPTERTIVAPPAGLSPTVPGPSPGRVPKARKGTRFVMPKTKGEESDLNVTLTESTKTRPAVSASVHQSDLSFITANQILASGLQEEVGVAESVQCFYCNDVFESRKALSCHARAHLRQLGVKWAQYTSPIDMLHELMIREGRGQGSDDMARRKSFIPSSTDFRDKMDATDAGTAVSEATCELCGFDFENRKALASHARAHLRQLGEQWSSSQSPIEVLRMWMNREPEKVRQLHQLYQQGELPHIRKRRISSLGISSHVDSAHSRVFHPPVTGQRKFSSHRPVTNTAAGSTHLLQGHEPHHPKLLSHSMEGTEVLKRVGNPPSLVPPPPETSLVKLVGKIYSLKCRFCEQVFHGPLSIQEDWLIHLRHHILNPSPTPPQPSLDTAQLIGQTV